MIRRKISEFIRNHKDKIKNLLSKLVIVAMAVAFATILLSSLSSTTTSEQEDKKNVYKPTDTVIKGSDISKEQYEQDSNLVNTFLDYCNNNKVEEAYALLTDECKEEMYHTVEEFKEYYLDSIFDKKRQCNLQAWISESQYIVYRVRYTNDMMSSGTYDAGDVYQDYITLNRKDDKEKISIGSFIDSEKCNIVTKTEGIEATVIEKKVYISDEEYEIYIKNTTDKTILLDNLKSNVTILLVAGGNEYLPYFNKLYVSNLTIKPGKIQRIKIRFIKNLSSNNKSEKIKFTRVIKDYDLYNENKEAYTDIKEIQIRVVD